MFMINKALLLHLRTQNRCLGSRIEPRRSSRVLQEFKKRFEGGFTRKGMSGLSASPFPSRQHQSPLILLCVSWYLEFTLSYRPLARLVKQQGWTMCHSGLFR